MRAFWCVAGGVGALALGAGAEASILYSNASVTAVAVIDDNIDGNSDSALLPTDPFSLAAAASQSRVDSEWFLGMDSAASVSVLDSAISGSVSKLRQWSVPHGQSVFMQYSASVTVEFSLQEASGFVLSGEWSVGSLSAMDVSFAIIDWTTGTTFLFEFSSDGDMPGQFSHSAFLSAGYYGIYATMSSEHTLTGGFGSNFSELNFSFFVPSPGAGCALAMLGLAALRRRR